MSKIKLPLSQAQLLAEKIVKELKPVTERIEVAGSIRRRKESIGDIEIVCIPLLETDLFGFPGASRLEPGLEVLISQGRIIKGDKWGPKYKKFHPVALPDLSVDLFITTALEWAYTFVIRTGSADFSHRVVTPRQHGGYLPGHLRVGGCRLWEGDTALVTPEERDFFEALGLEWIEPEGRV